MISFLLIPQLPRPVFDGAVQWAMKAERTMFWRSQRRPATKVESPRESIVSMRKAGTNGVSKQNRTEEYVCFISVESFVSHFITKQGRGAVVETTEPGYDGS